MHTLLAVDDGIWQGHFDLADILFLVAFIVFAIAAIYPAFHRVQNVDGTYDTRFNFGLSLVPAGLALVALGLAVL